MRATIVAPCLVTLALVAAGCSATSQQSGGNANFGAASTEQKPPCNTSQFDPATAHRGDIISSDLIGPDEVSGQLVNANSYRVRYVSTVRDTTDLRAVCGVVVLPSQGGAEGNVAKFNAEPRIVSWSHGTVGLPTACQPGQYPETRIFGKMATGIGPVVAGKSPTGALQTLINSGKAVASSDYFSGLGDESDFQPYMAGRVAAANSIDMISAAHALIAKTASQTGIVPPSKPVKTVLWGHSQGGDTAMFAGQLWTAGYQPVNSSGAPNSSLVGVAVAAPASNLVGSGEGTSRDKGLGDAIMHILVNPVGQTIEDTPDNRQEYSRAWNKMAEEVRIPKIPKNVIPIAPILFSQIFRGWDGFTNNKPTPKPDQLPAYLADSVPLDESVLTETGKIASKLLSAICVGAMDGGSLFKTLMAVAPFYPGLGRLGHNFFTEEFAGTRKDGGGVQRTCKNGEPTKYVNWCKWLLWNTDGPAGTNPYNSLPRLQGSRSFVPIYIAQGTNDRIVYCEAQEGVNPTTTEPCMARSLYQNVAKQYCPTSGAEGSLTLQYFNQIGHLGVMAASSTGPAEGGTNFSGSPVDKFIDQAFAGTTTPGCRVGSKPTEFPAAIPPSLTLDGQKIEGSTKSNPVRTKDPVLTWDVAVQEPDATVSVKVKGSSEAVAVSYGDGRIDFKSIPSWNKPGTTPFVMKVISPGSDTKILVAYYRVK